MGSRGSDYRRRSDIFDLYKEQYSALEGAIKSGFSGEANDKWNELTAKIIKAGYGDDFIAWINAGYPADWTPNKDGSQPTPTPEPTPEPEPEPQSTAESTETEQQGNTNYGGNERMNNAFYAKSAKEADDKLVPETQRAWTALDEQEKIALRSYSGKLAGEVNSYLWSGKTPTWEGTTTGEFYEGNIQKPIDLLTNAINKSSLQQDTWLERGLDMSDLGNFLGIKDVSEIDDIIESGQTRIHKGFMSTSSGDFDSYAKTHEVILKVFAPKGTKAMYINPISKFGDKQLEIGSIMENGHAVPKIIKDWDGKTSKANGGEIETILQRGLQFRTLAHSYDNQGRLIVTMEIVE